MRDVLALLTLGVVVAPLISAVIGVAALNLAWQVPSARVLQSALSWWLGDAMGVLLVTPVLLTGFALPLRPARVGSGSSKRRRWGSACSSPAR